MAGSRIGKLGTIFSRTSGLLKTGAIKESDKPLWYDVYAAFPPSNPASLSRAIPEDEVKPIFYPEDKIRAKFFQLLGSPGVIDMTSVDVSYKSPSQHFVERYQEKLKSQKGSSEGQIFEETREELKREGILFAKYSSDSNETKDERRDGMRERVKDVGNRDNNIDVSQFIKNDDK